MASHHQRGPPYPPTVALVGGLPNKSVDVPITAVFLALFLTGAISHMTILQLNLRKGHKFLISGALFGFCMSRILTCVMRIAWACYPHNVRVGIAASILVFAGVLILFIVNLIFAQRILRAAHPHFGWHKSLSRVLKVLYILIFLMLALVITVTIQSFYTLHPNTHRIDRDLQLTASTYFACFAVAPLFIVGLGLIIPRKTRVEKFGTGHWRTRVRILLTTTVLLTLGATFRVGTSYKTPRPLDDPAWYHAKWCFYIFDFTVEIITVLLYVVVRVDRRFHIPNGSHGPGDYSRGRVTDLTSEKSDEGRGSLGTVGRIMPEEEVFDDKPALAVMAKDEKVQTAC